MKVLLTGSSKGIGKELANLLNQDKHMVVGVARNATNVNTYQQIYCDLSNENSRNDAFTKVSEFAPFDAVIFNAGVNFAKPFIYQSTNEIEVMNQVNLLAPIEWTHQLLQNNLLSQQAHLIYVSSLSYQLSYPGASFYSATKDGLTHFAHSLAASHKDLNISLVFPGPTDTDMAITNSPNPNSKKTHPDRVAQLIYSLLKNKKMHGYSNISHRLLGFMGTWMPLLSEKLMQQIIAKPLNKIYERK